MPADLRWDTGTGKEGAHGAQEEAREGHTLSARVRPERVWREVEAAYYLCARREGDAALQRVARRDANVTDAVLSTALKELVVDGVVKRRSFDEVPPHVEYSLTGRGESVVPILRDICRWAGQTHRQVTSDAPRQCQVCDYVDVEIG